MFWNVDLDALAFRPDGHEGLCLVHRLAFRAMLRDAPTPENCLRLATAWREAFEEAARAKIAARSLPGAARFHLNSRDIRRALSACGAGEPPQEEPGEAAQQDP
jgi:hypothetical protein